MNGEPRRDRKCGKTYGKRVKLVITIKTRKKFELVLSLENYCEVFKERFYVVSGFRLHLDASSSSSYQDR